MSDEFATSSVITQKATLAAKAGGLNPNVFDPTTIITIIVTLFKALSACGGIFAPTPAYIHRAVTNPGPFQRKNMRQAIREEVDNPALWGHVEQGILSVGRSSTQEETSAMYLEATGASPE